MGIFDVFWRFLYVGLFTVGGGLASIPLLLHAIVEPGYVTEELFYNMIAISESTPGPIGVNLATYIGYNMFGVGGGIITTLALVIPCFVISYLVSRAFQKVKDTPVISAAFYGVRATVVGLIAVAAYGVLSITVIQPEAFAAGDLPQLFNWNALIVFAALTLFVIKGKKHPIWTIAIGAVAGVLLF